MPRSNYLLFVPGDPAPQGSKRYVGNGRFIEASKKVVPWRAAVADAVRRSSFDDPFTEPVFVDVTFFLPRPKSVKRIWPSVPPDLDKLERGLNDALVLAGVLEDDSLIVMQYSRKEYADFNECGATVFIRLVDELPLPNRDNAIRKT